LRIKSEMNTQTLILEGESEVLEFKKSAGEYREVIETVSAFLRVFLDGPGKAFEREIEKEKFQELMTEEGCHAC